MLILMPGFPELACNIRRFRSTNKNLWVKREEGVRRIIKKPIVTI
jgi:hypothetical protein